MSNILSDFLFNDENIFIDEDLLFYEDDDSPELPPDDEQPSWSIMIVDDDNAIHLATKLSLKEFSFDGRAFSFVSAYSGEEAKNLIKEYPDTALILLDVVMESNNSGLMVTKYIREVLQNERVRIILRTGHPGEAPEESVILAYDINDYKIKTELTQQKLFTTIISALRSYRDLTIIKNREEQLKALSADLERQNIELKRLNEQLEDEIAERKKLEGLRFEQERLRIENIFLDKQSRELAKLNADKDKFFSIVAHDLKGPFQPLLGFTEMLLLIAKSATPEQVEQISKSIYGSARNVYDLLENLLHWSRMQRGHMEYEPGEISLQEVFTENINLFTPTAESKGIKLYSQVPEKLFAYAAKKMLKTVIRNLTSNALKFTPSGGEILISAQRFKGQADETPQWIELSLRDTGHGISSQNLKKIFKIDSPFTTLGTAEEKGTGLGLIICQEMIEKNGGQMWIDSELNKGTTVRFTVPAM
jgi:signal transduction histidine kinase